MSKEIKVVFIAATVASVANDDENGDSGSKGSSVEQKDASFDSSFVRIYQYISRNIKFLFFAEHERKND
jgi:hypothetical protein